MTNILLYGIGGKMGKMVFDCAISDGLCKIVCGVDKFAVGIYNGIPVYSSIFEAKEHFDVIIDFSARQAISDILKYAVEKNIPCVLCTTGYNTEEQSLIFEASKKVAIFQSGNMSLGVNVLSKLAKMATTLFGEKADIEIIESHHNQKIDAPSGTALLLANSIKSAKSNAEFVFGRNGEVGKRSNKEIGIHAIRGGTIVGKHEVQFILNNEVITLKHEAENKGVFALGALDAAKFISRKSPSLYDMNDMLTF